MPSGLLRLREIERAAASAERLVMSRSDAVTELLRRLRAGHISANAILKLPSTRTDVPKYLWADLRLYGDAGRGEIVAGSDERVQPSGIPGMLLDKADILRVWPPVGSITTPAIDAHPRVRASRRRHGKRPRIRLYLTDHYPNGVPEPAYLPRHKLRADILQYDPSLAPLDEGTLKTAVDEYNQEIAQHSAVSETIRK